MSQSSNALPNAAGQRPVSPQEQDLLLRLYREIGISAVAAALQIGEDAARQSRISAQIKLNKDRGIEQAA